MMTHDIKETKTVVIPQRAADPNWEDCPCCNQSATGQYGTLKGIFRGCARCGWPNPRKIAF